MKQKHFNVCSTEINRRVGAYISLAMSWPAVVAGGSMLLPAAKQMPALLLSACILAIMSVIGALTLPFLRRSHLHTVYELGPKTLKRLVGADAKETIDLGKIKKIHVKYVSYGPIREISLVESNGRRHNLDGAEQFELLRDGLIQACPNAQVSTSREPINYDHVLFYPTLGAIGGAICLLILALGSSSAQFNRAVALVVSILVLSVSVHIAKTSPLSQQYGPAAKKSDWILAVSLAITAVIVGVFVMVTL
ncbi:MAG TPA: hypothetical protein VFT16_02285 [Candidatus Saccharimonadales bacterium]|nr:hypothetical protein [Candidatus Saccharimonadales bacterium]